MTAATFLPLSASPLFPSCTESCTVQQPSLNQRCNVCLFPTSPPQKNPEPKHAKQQRVKSCPSSVWNDTSSQQGSVNSRKPANNKAQTSNQKRADPAGAVSKQGLAFSSLSKRQDQAPRLQHGNSETVLFSYLPILTLFIKNIFRIRIYDIDLAMNCNRSTLLISVTFSLSM